MEPFQMNLIKMLQVKAVHSLLLYHWRWGQIHRRLCSWHEQQKIYHFWSIFIEISWRWNNRFVIYPDGKKMYACVQDSGCKDSDNVDFNCDCLLEFSHTDGKSSDGSSLSLKLYSGVWFYTERNSFGSYLLTHWFTYHFH